MPDKIIDEYSARLKVYLLSNMYNEIYCGRERLTCEGAGSVVSDCYKTARKYDTLIKSRRQLAAVFMLRLETWGQPAVFMFSNDGLLVSRLLRACVCVCVCVCPCVRACESACV